MLHPNSEIYSPSDKLYDSVLRSYLNSLNPPPKYEYHPHSKKVAVMIEPRYDDTTIAVLYNFMHYMAPPDTTSEYSRGWNFMFISYKEHESAVKERFPHMNFVALEDKHIEMSNGLPNISIQGYNSIMLSKDFWEKTIPDKYNIVCIFQRDCIMYRPIPRVFETYSFAGAVYGDLITENEFIKSTTFFSGGINGGFSIRNRKHMLFCIDSMTVDHIKRYREGQKMLMRDVLEMKYKLSKKTLVEFNYNLTNEDVFFSNACEILGLFMPDGIHCAQLSVEMPNASILSEKPAVYHGWNKNYHSYIAAVKYLSQTELFAKFVETEVSKIPKVIEETSKTTTMYVLPKNLSD